MSPAAESLLGQQVLVGKIIVVGRRQLARRIRPASLVPSSTIRAYALGDRVGGNRGVETGLPVDGDSPGAP